MNITEVRKFVKENNIPTEIIEHPEADGLTSEQAAAAHGVGLESIVKTLLFVDKEENKAFVIIQGGRRVDTKKIPGLRKPRLARAEELREWLDAEPGAVPPIALPKEMNKFVDEGVIKQESVIGSAGNRFSGIKIKPEFIVNQPNTRVLDLAEER